MSDMKKANKDVNDSVVSDLLHGFSATLNKYEPKPKDAIVALATMLSMASDHEGIDEMVMMVDGYQISVEKITQETHAAAHAQMEAEDDSTPVPPKSEMH